MLAEELAGIAGSFGCAALRAQAHAASARVALAREDAEAALVAARVAVREWASLSASYEVARSREEQPARVEAHARLTGRRFDEGQ